MLGCVSRGVAYLKTLFKSLRYCFTFIPNVAPPSTKTLRKQTRTANLLKGSKDYKTLTLKPRCFQHPNKLAYVGISVLIMLVTQQIRYCQVGTICILKHEFYSLILWTFFHCIDILKLFN